jgi:hypothetical protein
MQSQLIADHLNGFTYHETKFTVEQIDKLSEALATDPKLAKEFARHLKRHHNLAELANFIDQEEAEPHS